MRFGVGDEEERGRVSMYPPPLPEVGEKQVNGLGYKGKQRCQYEGSWYRKRRPTMLLFTEVGFGACWTCG